MRQIPTLLLAALTMAAFAAEAQAEFNFAYPRLRHFNDLTSPSRKSAGGEDRRYFAGAPAREEITGPQLYFEERLIAGASATYASDYMWREFLLSRSNLFGALDAYVGYYGISRVHGVEASIFVADDLQGRDAAAGSPFEVDYRLAYSFFWENSGETIRTITTLSYTHYDFSRSAPALGRTSQGFGTPPVNFAPRQNELRVNSMWYPDLVSVEGANLLFGMDGHWWADENAFRGQLIAGMFARRGRKQESEYDLLLPNTALAMGTISAQAHYHTTTNSITGSFLWFEAGWDYRDHQDLPIILAAGVEYFYPWSDKQFTDRLHFRIRLEVAF